MTASRPSGGQDCHLPPRPPPFLRRPSSKYQKKRAGYLTIMPAGDGTASGYFPCCPPKSAERSNGLGRRSMPNGTVPTGDSIWSPGRKRSVLLPYSRLPVPEAHKECVPYLRVDALARVAAS